MRERIVSWNWRERVSVNVHVCNEDFLDGPMLGTRRGSLYCIKDSRSADKPADRAVYFVQRRLWCKGDKKLRRIGVRPIVCKRQHASRIMTQRLVKLVCQSST